MSAMVMPKSSWKPTASSPYRSNPLSSPTELFLQVRGGDHRALPSIGKSSFPPGYTDSYFKHISSQGKFRVCDYLVDSRLKTRAEIQLMLNPPLDPWRLQQLTHFLSCLRRQGWSNRLNSPLENLCLAKAPSTHGVSEAYKVLIHPPEGFVPGFLWKWERDLDKTFSDEQHDHILYFVPCSSVVSKHQELSYKILTQWHKVPSLLQKIYPDATNICWRCREAEGTMLHIFWSCLKLERFWSKVREIIKQLTELDLGSDPARYLLHLSDFSKPKYKNSMVAYLLNVAKNCIPALLRSRYGLPK